MKLFAVWSFRARNCPVCFSLNVQKRVTKNKMKRLDPVAVYYVSLVSTAETINALTSEGDYHECNGFSSVVSRILAPEYIKIDYDWCPDDPRKEARRRRYAHEREVVVNLNRCRQTRVLWFCNAPSPRLLTYLLSFTLRLTAEAVHRNLDSGCWTQLGSGWAGRAGGEREREAINTAERRKSRRRK